MLGFGEKQPALDDEAEGRARDGETRRDHPGHAADRQREQRQEGGQSESGAGVASSLTGIMLGLP